MLNIFQTESIYPLYYLNKFLLLLNPILVAIIPNKAPPIKPRGPVVIKAVPLPPQILPIKTPIIKERMPFIIFSPWRFFIEKERGKKKWENC